MPISNKTASLAPKPKDSGYSGDMDRYKIAWQLWGGGLYPTYQWSKTHILRAPIPEKGFPDIIGTLCGLIVETDRMAEIHEGEFFETGNDCKICERKLK